MEAIIYANDVLHMPEMSLEIFIDRQKTLSDQVYWDLLRTQWITAGKSENIGIFLELFRSKRRHRDWFMTLEDAAFLESLPDEFEAYRAARDKDDLGVSWTLDKEFAEKYAAAYGRVVLTRQVKKSEVFAYISRRGESELLILEAAR